MGLSFKIFSFFEETHSVRFVENEVKWDLLGVHDISIKLVKI